jgi:hypothetical protein
VKAWRNRIGIKQNRRVYSISSILVFAFGDYTNNSKAHDTHFEKITLAKAYP